MNLVNLTAFTYPHEAHMAKNFLESEGIAVFLKDELTAQVYQFNSNAIGGVKLCVYENDFPLAVEALKKGGYITDEIRTVETLQSNSSTDLSVCPFCNSKNIGKNKEANLLTIITYFILGFLFPIFRTSYKCFDCDKEWRYSKK